MRAITAAAFTIVLAVGCGSSPIPINTVDPNADALDGVREAVSEALDAIRESSVPLGPEEERDATSSPSVAVKGVVKAAQELVKAAAGTPLESDATSILNDAQEIEKQAGGPAMQLTQRLQDLRAKLAAIRARK